ncbi:MAG TPA: putative lipid II flippase FtsW [Tissierellaceae bacterium]|nr:putative lipid II flippase FtsW [Tissierellaceae bacterium]
MARNKKTKRRAVDFTLLLTIIILVFIGIIMVFSASWPEAMAKHNNDGYYFLKRQLSYAILGFFGLIIMMNFDYRHLKRLAPLIYILSIISGLLLFTSLGKELKGATRWLDLKIITIMPSDIIKVGSIIFFASFLSNKREKITSLVHGTIPALIYIAISCGIIVTQDLGTAVTLAGTMFAMFFVAGMKFTHLIPLGLGAGGLLWYAIHDSDHPHRIKRLTAFRDPFADKLGDGWQVVQSLYALGSGGLFGLGLGKSRQKFFYISEAYNDFIFAIIGEELGLLGTLLVLILFMIVIWRGIIIALKVEDVFACFLATGITALIAVQSMIHIAVVTSSIPTTGITLPFISYGGTSLVIYMAAVGILLNISRHANLGRN